MDTKVLNQTEELVNAIKGYMDKDIVVMSIDQLQTFDKVDIAVNDESIILESGCEDNMIKFLINKIKDVYIDEIDIFEEKEIHIVFTYNSRKYSILNLV